MMISLTTASKRGDIHFIFGGAESTAATTGISSTAAGGTTIGASLQENKKIIIPEKDDRSK